jgi:hypothetical protein
MKLLNPAWGRLGKTFVNTLQISGKIFYTLLLRYAFQHKKTVKNFIISLAYKLYIKHQLNDDEKLRQLGHLNIFCGRKVPRDLLV